MNLSSMMNPTGGWMSGGIVIWTVAGIVIVVVLFVVISKWSKK